MSITKEQFENWKQWSKLDQAHQYIMPSDIRQMLGEIERLRAALIPFAKQLEYWRDDDALASDRPPDEALAMISPRIWNRPDKIVGEAAITAFSYGDLRRAKALSGHITPTDRT